MDSGAIKSTSSTKLHNVLDPLVSHFFFASHYITQYFYNLLCSPTTYLNNVSHIFIHPFSLTKSLKYPYVIVTPALHCNTISLV